MRLTLQQVEIFKQLADEILGSGSQLFLFGSRVDDQCLGGDIDLYVTGFCGTVEQRLEAKLRFLVEAKLKLGEQRIDLVFAPLAGEQILPIHKIAERTGVLL